MNPDWCLEPTINRLMRLLDVPPDEYAPFLKTHLESFQYSARGRRGNNPARLEEENDWWALGQHYGLATPLLDWTHSPFVAAYFAFLEESTELQYRAVYALHKKQVELYSPQFKNISTSTPQIANFVNNYKPDIEFLKPLSDENQRLVQQNGLFSRSSNEDIDTWVEKRFTHFTGSESVLEKILIPSIAREDCLRSLNRMNINHLTLFPDLYGAAKFCNLNKKIAYY